MINVRLATIEDIIQAHSEAKDVFKGEEQAINNLIRVSGKGRLYTIYNSDGRIYGVVGGIVVRPGVASVASILTPHVYSEPVSIIRVARRMVQSVAVELNLHRLEFTGLASSTEVARWAKALGFEAEGVLKSYGSDKSDYVMYGRVG